MKSKKAILSVFDCDSLKRIVDDLEFEAERRKFEQMKMLKRNLKEKQNDQD